MRKTYYHTTCFWLATTLIASSMSLFASETEWFEIELMVAAPLHHDALVNEYWPIDPGIPMAGLGQPLRTLESLKATLSEVKSHQSEQLLLDSPFNTLLEEDAEQQLTPADYARTITPKWQWNFNDSEKKIINHPDYRLLLHTAWRQPISENNSIVRLVGGQKFALTDEELQQLQAGGLFDPNDYTVTSSEQQELISLTAPMIPPKYPNFSGVTTPYELEGILSIKNTRFLHADIDLVVQLPAKTVEIQQAESLDDLFPGYHSLTLVNPTHWQVDPFTRLQSFRLIEKRKMRPREFHYFDHPAIAVFLRVVPIDAPDIGLELDS